MIYAGIGSRETPPDVLKLMFWLGELILNEEGSTLRTGGAPGADQSFEAGAAASMLRSEGYIQKHTEIFLPWASFEKDNRSWILPRLTEPAEWAYEIAAEYHPRWSYLKPAVRRLHARNVHQVLGPSPDSPITDAVLCWTPGASGSGGTGQAIRIAGGYGVEVFDLADWDMCWDVCDSFQIPISQRPAIA